MARKVSSNELHTHCGNSVDMKLKSNENALALLGTSRRKKTSEKSLTCPTTTARGLLPMWKTFSNASGRLLNKRQIVRYLATREILVSLTSRLPHSTGHYDLLTLST